MGPKGTSPFLRNVPVTCILALCGFVSPWMPAGHAQAVPPVRVPLLPNGTPAAVQVNAECDSILSSLQANDLEEAARQARILPVGLEQNYHSWIHVSYEDRLPSKAEFLGEIRETAATACSTIRAALAANDPSRAYAAGLRLSMVLERLVAALPSSPHAKFARMEKVVSQLSGL